MARFRWAFIGLFLSQAYFSLAAPTSPSQEPCAQVAAAQAKRRSEDPKAVNFTVSAELAHACLASVPFKSKDALQLIDGLSYFWDWQTTKDYLKNPPRGYRVPGTDLEGGLAKIRDKAARNRYRGELEFQTELDALVRTVHDGHFNLGMDLITTFTFTRSGLGPIASLSEDGKHFPKIYSLGRSGLDLFLSFSHIANIIVHKDDLQGRSTKPSAIKTIDGHDAVAWLAVYSYKQYFQDPDALYNGLLYNLPRTRVSANGAFWSTRAIDTGSKITVGFENGTTKGYENTATSTANFTGVKDGQTFYEKFCSGTTPAASLSEDSREKTFPYFTADPSSESSPIAATPRSIPLAEPIRESKDGAVAGYFLEGDHANVAVLSLRSFVGAASSNDPLSEYSDTITKFLEDCRKASKERLIIDVSGNRGGTIFLGYDAFKQLLPKGKIDTPMNLRAIEQFDIMGTKINYLLNNRTAPNSPAAERERNDIFDLNAYVDVDGKKFKSWPDYFGPDRVGTFNFTRLAYWDFNNIEMSLKSGGLIVSGYGNRSNIAPQAFKTENMVLVTDGICASTCAIFADLLNRNGIKSIATGGHPRAAPMQAVGGVKGTQVLSFKELWSEADLVFSKYSTPEEQHKLENTRLGMMVRRGKYVLGRLLDGGTGGRVNYRNAVWPSDPNRVPRQFVYEPADCRMWLTKDALVDVKRWWGTVAGSWWGNKSGCVPGSTPRPG
ncbi:hypothetical protein PRK78_002424 [Emydomyces testavorans]|uniref:Tail specific protease domain-containing protein n=1 Tax=Emydomyces testavorans TaxID=2070801 RepID=A0AAF0IGG1_9EURO|nr:hypothetical protein PRK78_002424 [Emydomyces testavorans]